MSQDDTDCVDGPPALPEKTKRRSQIQNMLEMVSNAGLHSGSLSPHSSPHNSMILSGNTSFLDFSLNSSNGSLHSQTSCPSPTSSTSSGLNQSVEDLIAERHAQLGGNFSKTVSDSTLMKKSSVISSSHSERTVNQINQLTQEIDNLTKLTENWQAKSRQKQGEMSESGGPPPLPNKASKLNRHMSHYDNVPDGATIESAFLSSNVVSNRTIISRTVTSRVSQTSEARLSSSSTSSTQSFSGVQMQKSNTISFSHQMSGQEDAYSSSGSFSSASHSSMDSIQKNPPPLPPKQKHSK